MKRLELFQKDSFRRRKEATTASADTALCGEKNTACPLVLESRALPTVPQQPQPHFTT